MNPVTLKLSTPIPAHGEEVSEIVILPPATKHLRKMPAGSLKIGHFLDLLSDVTSLPSFSIDRLHPGDSLAAVEVLSRFLERRADGATASS